MLYNIATTDNNDVFKKCYEYISRSFYSEIDYEPEYNQLPDWTTKTRPKDEEKIRQVNNKLDQIIHKICCDNDAEGMYFKIEGDIERMKFPFIERFHKYF